MPSSVSANIPNGKLISIQYVRALAAIVVVGWHTGWSYTVVGQVGVDLFFVVSGFVIMLVSGREKSPGRFALARVLRIAPFYWIITIYVYAFSHDQFGKLLTSLLFWPNGLFPIVIQGWSLNLEMMYYFLFSLTLFFPIRRRISLLSLGMVVVVFGLPRIIPINNIVLTWANPLAFEFLAGACLYRAWQSNYFPTGKSAWLMGVVGAAFLACTHLLGGAPQGWERVGLWGIPSIAIVSAGLGIERAGQLPKIKLFEILGEASYSIYLTHILALRLVAEHLQRFWAPTALAVAMVWACLIGWVIFNLIELPTQKLGKYLLRRVGLERYPRSSETQH